MPTAVDEALARPSAICGSDRKKVLDKFTIKSPFFITPHQFAREAAYKAFIFLCLDVCLRRLLVHYTEWWLHIKSEKGRSE